MQKIDGPGATVENEFTEGNPSTGTPATVVLAKWLNSVQRELVALVEEFGGELDDEDDEQIAALIISAIENEVAGVVANAPSDMNTLEKIAAAIGDDPGFAATVAAALADKLDLSGGTLTNFLTLHANPTSNLHAATKQYVDGRTVPPGAVFYFAANSPPSGYLECDGSAVSRATYADLFATVGTTFGVGNGSTTFNLPDLRGEFIRGWDDGRGVDTGRAFGTAQADELKAHRHALSKRGGNNSNTSTSLVAGALSATTAFDADIMDNTGGTETRPRNIALLACIKT